MRASSAGAWINDRASNSRMPLTVRAGERQRHFSRCWLEPNGARTGAHWRGRGRNSTSASTFGLEGISTLRQSPMFRRRSLAFGGIAFVDRDATELAQEPVPAWSPTDQWHARHSQLFTVLVPIDGAGGSAYSLIASCREQTRLSGCERHRRRPVLTCAHPPYSAIKIGQNGAIFNRR
jgi:hypothetical protein